MVSQEKNIRVYLEISSLDQTKYEEWKMFYELLIDQMILDFYCSPQQTRGRAEIGHFLAETSF